MKRVNFGLSLSLGPASDRCGASIALYNQVAIEVHRDTGWNLCYRVGQVKGMDIVWPSQAVIYDNGTSPSVSLNQRSFVIEVHQGSDQDNLFYRSGQVNGATITFNGSTGYDNGRTPDVSLSENMTFVEVHKAGYGGDFTDLWLYAGLLTSSTGVFLSKPQQFASNARNPKVASQMDGFFIVVYEKNDGYIYYRTGAVSRSIGTPPAWLFNLKDYEVKVVAGLRPSICISKGFVVLMYEVLEGSESVVYSRTAALKPAGDGFYRAELTTWPSFKMGVRRGDYFPSVSGYWYSPYVAQIHSKIDGELWYSTSLISAREQWMSELYPTIKDRPLWQLTLPGSHDSGAFNMEKPRVPSTCRTSNLPTPEWLLQRLATCQENDPRGIFRQLTSGIRFLDLRPTVNEGKVSLYHDLLGVSLDDTLNDIGTFLAYGASRSELVIAKVWHFCFPQDGVDYHAQIIRQLNDLKTFFVTTVAETDLLTTKLDDLITQKVNNVETKSSRLIVWYDDDYIKTHPQAGMFRTINMYDSYSNTTSFTVMKSDQLDKLKNNPPTASQLFLLSWTLTIDWKTTSYSLHELSAYANPYLGQTIAAGLTAQPNILYTDFVDDARTTDCANLLNQNRPTTE